MKILFSFLVAILAPAGAAQPLYEDPASPPDSELVAIEAEHIFIPEGFDDNDEITVVVDGYLPDSCYRVIHNEAILNPDTGSIKIVQMARRFNSLCLPVRVPYSNEANLGVLPMGTFEVSVDGASTETLRVAEATNAGPDDYYYAPIDSARVEADFTNSRYTAILAGRFTNTCMAWDDVRVLPSEKSIVIMPIIKLDDRTDCVEEEVPFSWRVTLPDNLDRGRHLLHVRSLNGKAINHMFTVLDPALPPIH